jgi:hypothetical protein
VRDVYDCPCARRADGRLGFGVVGRRIVPKALAFERADPASIDAAAAQRWSRRSVGRLPLDLVTCGALLAAVVTAARLT